VLALPLLVAEWDGGPPVRLRPLMGGAGAHGPEYHDKQVQDEPPQSFQLELPEPKGAWPCSLTCVDHIIPSHGE
jgi:hypothetical protein